MIRWCFAIRCLAMLLTVHTAMLAGTPRALAVTPKAAEADAIAEEAKRRFRQGDYVIAAQLFVRANQLDPRPDRLYNIARCEEKLKHYEAAAKLLQEYIDRTQDVAGREEARIRLAELQRLAAEEQALARKAAEKAAADKAAQDQARAQQAEDKARADQAAAEKAAREKATADRSAADRAAAAKALDLPRNPTPVIVNPPATHPPVRSLTWVTAGVGGGAALTGLALYLTGVAGDGTLQGQVDKTQAGYVQGTTQAAARADQHAHANLRTAGSVVGLAGIAVLGLGTWLWWRDSQATVSLAPTGFAIAGRF